MVKSVFVRAGHRKRRSLSARKKDAERKREFWARKRAATGGTSITSTVENHEQERRFSLPLEQRLEAFDDTSDEKGPTLLVENTPCTAEGNEMEHAVIAVSDRKMQNEQEVDNIAQAQSSFVLKEADALTKEAPQHSKLLSHKDTAFTCWTCKVEKAVRELLCGHVVCISCFSAIQGARVCFKCAATNEELNRLRQKSAAMGKFNAKVTLNSEGLLTVATCADPSLLGLFFRAPKTKQRYSSLKKRAQQLRRAALQNHLQAAVGGEGAGVSRVEDMAQLLYHIIMAYPSTVPIISDKLGLRRTLGSDKGGVMTTGPGILGYMQEKMKHPPNKCGVDVLAPDDRSEKQLKTCSPAGSVASKRIELAKNCGRSHRYDRETAEVLKRFFCRQTNEMETATENRPR